MDISKRLVTQELVSLRWNYRNRLIRYGISKGTLSIPAYEELTKDELTKTVSFLGNLIEMVTDIDDDELKHLQSKKRKPFMDK